MRFFKGVLISEIFVLWVEFFYKFGVTDNPKAFFIAIPLYFLYLCALHLIFKIFKEGSWLGVSGILIGGVTGLFLEWFLVGNSPWNKPTAFQFGQFLYHGAYPILGYLLAHTSIPARLRHHLVYYMVAASGITSIGFFLTNLNLRKLWLLILPLMVYLGLYYFIYRLRAQRLNPTP